MSLDIGLKFRGSCVYGPYISLGSSEPGRTATLVVAVAF